MVQNHKHNNAAGLWLFGGLFFVLLTQGFAAFLFGIVVVLALYIALPLIYARYITRMPGDVLMRAGYVILSVLLVAYIIAKIFNIQHW